jgi:hypothetical protein
MAIRGTISFILTGFLILFIFTGSCHSFCECYAQNCSIHAHANPQNSLWIFQARPVTDTDRPDVPSYLSLFEDVFVYSSGFLTPLKARAPPYETFPQIIASR